MKNLAIKLCTFIAIIAFFASCNKSETAIDKFAALEAEKEQIITYIENNNLGHYTTTINTELTEAERLMYVKDIPSNNIEPDIELVKQAKELIGETNMKAGEIGNVYIIRLPWTECSFIYYGYSSYPRDKYGQGY